MKKRLLFILCLVFVTASLAFSQRRTITNTDLEKFRQKRLQAEADYRENYERLGFPSPEELEKQREQDRKALSELSERLTNERMEREAMQREEDFRQAQLNIMRGNSGTYYNQDEYYGNGYYPFVYSGAYPFYGYSNYGFSNGFHNRNRYGNRRGGYFYDSISPAPVVHPQSGVRINTNGVRISITRGGNRFPAQIRNPR